MKAIFSSTIGTAIVITLAITSCLSLAALGYYARDESKVRTVTLERDWQFEGVWHRVGTKVQCGGYVLGPTRDCPEPWFLDKDMSWPTATSTRRPTSTPTPITPSPTATATMTPRPTGTLIALAQTVVAGYTVTALAVKAGVAPPTRTPGPHERDSLDQFYAFTINAWTVFWIVVGTLVLIAVFLGAVFGWKVLMGIGKALFELILNVLKLIVVPLGFITQALGLLEMVSVGWAGTISALLLTALGLIAYAIYWFVTQ